MIKTVIANRAVGGWGKSTTLKAVYEKLKEIYPDMEPKSPLINNGDIKAVFTIENIKIGLETQGDPDSRIFQSINDFIEYNCDLIICACRTRGETIDKVRSLRQHNYRIIWAPNFSSNQKDTHPVLNDLYVSNLVQMTDKILKGKL